MGDRYYARCAWTTRDESDAQFARRGAEWFRELSRLEPELRRWYDFKTHPRNAFEVFPTEEQMLGRFKQTRKSRGECVFAAWNGQEKTNNVCTGMMSGMKRVGGSCTVDFYSDEGDIIERMLRPEMLAQLLRSMVRIWEPDRAVVTSSAFLDIHDRTNGRLPAGLTFCGWLTYRPTMPEQIPPLPPPVQVEPVEDKGSLIILTPERLTASNPAHVALGKTVQRILVDAGLMNLPADT